MVVVGGTEGGLGRGAERWSTNNTKVSGGVKWCVWWLCVAVRGGGVSYVWWCVAVRGDGVWWCVVVRGDAG